MSARSLALLLLISAGCGGDVADSVAPLDDGGVNPEPDANSGPVYEDAAVDSVCKTQAFDEGADEKIHAALCIAMSEPGEFGCDYREGEDTTVVCTGLAGNIVVEFDQAGVGTAHYATAQSDIGTVTARADAFDLSLAEGKTGVCTVEGDAVELCI